MRETRSWQLTILSATLALGSDILKVPSRWRRLLCGSEGNYGGPLGGRIHHVRLVIRVANVAEELLLTAHATEWKSCNCAGMLARQ